MYTVIAGVVDEDSFFEIKPSFAPELITGLARIQGAPVGIIANQPKRKGGVLFVDSADKAARFIFLCDAFGIPLVFLVDVPGFMVGKEVERRGIIRHGAKMLHAMASTDVPRFCVVLRKAYGAGLYAMSGPGFRPTATIALPTARIGAMSPEAAVNAVYANKLAEMGDPAEREVFEAKHMATYAEDIDLLRLASDLVVEAVVEPDQLRSELAARLRIASRWSRPPQRKHRPIPPV